MTAGGYGTLEEIIEMITWQQLGFHTKPIGFLNTNGFYDHLLRFFDHTVSEVSAFRTRQPMHQLASWLKHHP